MRDEHAARDAALELVASGKHNYYEEILPHVEDYLNFFVRPGTRLTCKDVRSYVFKTNPRITPKELRVMGKVMLQMQKLGLIDHYGQTTRGRSHAGWGTEWIRTSKRTI